MECNFAWLIQWKLDESCRDLNGTVQSNLKSAIWSFIELQEAWGNVLVYGNIWLASMCLFLLVINVANHSSVFLSFVDEGFEVTDFLIFFFKVSYQKSIIVS